MRVNYSVILVSDMSRSVAFYRDVLEIPLRFESPGWSEFETGGATLALHPSDQARPEDLVETAGQCRTGFQVPDFDQFHARMNEHKVECRQPPTKVWDTRVAQYVDPDGLVFSVGEERS
jgi:lactoylglutathione lyase